MSRSFIYLRRALFGTSCAIVFGFGATQAFGAPAAPSFNGCLDHQRVQCQTHCEIVWGPYAVSTCYATRDYTSFDCVCGYL